MTEPDGHKRPKYLRLGEGARGGDGVGHEPVVSGDGGAPAFTLTIGELGALVREQVAEALGRPAPRAPLLLDREALAEALGCSSSLVDKLRRQGMPTLKFGESPRFELDRCLEWIRKQGAA